MLLEKLKYGASWLSTALDEGTKKFIYLLCLPLVDGVFATLLVTGGVESILNMVSVSLTIFAGAGSLAVLFSYAESRKDALRRVVTAAPLLVLGALAVSLIAPAYEQILDLGRMQTVAGVILLIISLEMLEFEKAKKIPPEAVLILGLLFSVKDPGALTLSFEYVIPAFLTSSIALIGLFGASLVDVKRIKLNVVRKGASLVLIIISASMFGLKPPPGLALSVLAVSVVLSLDLEGLDLKTHI